MLLLQLPLLHNLKLKKAKNMKFLPVNTVYFTELKVFNYMCVTTGTAAELHRGPGFAQLPAGQSRTGHSLGPASVRRPSAGDPAAGVEAVPGPAGRHPGSAQQCSGQTPADGAEVSAS